MSNEWLSNIKEGDKVLISEPYGRDAIGTVERLTATQLVVNSRRFRRRDGRSMCGDSWSRSYLHELTSEKHDKLCRIKAAAFIATSESVMRDMPLNDLGEFAAKIRDFTKARDALAVVEAKE